ncbi:uncharacterized protein LOC114533693 [Dendronephthya gigantea]|uniref:uncharacterized protein LOC114533693 n=1 Tax=Dendronephthya gigantea TaxID=151771 RepID=UPI00106BB7F0|nr:uncharacterized protein LOC114533693 [Dendronephthya gigantea]
MILYKILSNLITFKILCLQINIADKTFPKGHLKPLGSHRSPESIDERFDVPSPLEFWTDYVKISKPVVFRGAAKHSKAFTSWTDKYLKQNYGDLEVRLENKGEKSGGVPIGAKGLGRDTIAHFVDTYHDVNSYIVSELPTPMWSDILVQPCLTCGTFSDHIVEIDLWMSGGGSKSLLHKDAFNAINCLYNGTKEWKMIEYKYEKMIYKAWEPEYEVGGYSLLQVDSVDLIKYPKVKDVPWSFVTVNAGDCLFLPKSYYHQVNSYGSNNVAVAILFSRLDNLEKYNNTGCDSQNLSYLPLSQLDVDWKYPGHGKMTMGNSHLETARELLKEASQGGPLTLESIPVILEEHLHWRVDSESLPEEIFHILSKDNQAVISQEDIDSLGKDDLRKLLLLLERYEPSNMYTYEYSFVREEDIRLLIDTLMKQDGVLILDKFIKEYQQHLGGTEAFASQIFQGLKSAHGNMATPEEVEKNLDTVLHPYIQYRKKAGIKNDYHSNDDDDDNNDDDPDDDDNDDSNYPDDNHDRDDSNDPDDRRDRDDNKDRNEDDDDINEGLRDEL